MMNDKACTCHNPPPRSHIVLCWCSTWHQRTGPSTLQIKTRVEILKVKTRMKPSFQWRLKVETRFEIFWEFQNGRFEKFSFGKKKKFFVMEIDIFVVFCFKTKIWSFYGTSFLYIFWYFLFSVLRFKIKTFLSFTPFKTFVFHFRFCFRFCDELSSRG